MISPKIRYLLLFAVKLLLFSCGVNKHLPENTSLIVKQKIELQKNNQPIPNKNLLVEGLETLARPQPNKKIFKLFPHSLSAYYKTRENKKYGWFKRWIKNTFAETPALFDSNQVVLNVQNMHYFLAKEGYFDNIVKPKISQKRKKTRISYIVQLNKLYRINSITLHSSDSALHQLLKQHETESFLKPGAIVSQKNYDLEINRIGELMRNNGYADFLPIYIDQLRGDSLGNYRLEVFQKNDSIAHKRFQFGQIKVYLNEPKPKNDTMQSDTVNGIIYYYQKPKPYLKLKLLDKKIELRPHTLYQKNIADKTQANLGRISTLRQVNLQTSSPKDSSIVNYDIIIRRKPKYLFNSVLKGGYVTLAAGQRNRIGVTGTADLTHNNVFRGGAHFNSNISGSLEFNLFQPSIQQGLISTDIQWINSIHFPSFKLNMGLYKLLNSFGISSKAFQDNLEQTANTRIKAGIQYIHFTDFYSYQNYEIELSHEFNHGKVQYELNQTGIVYWKPRTTPGFDTININNPNLLRSFEPRLVTGLFFRNLIFQYKNPVSTKSTQFSLIGQFESSGHEVFVANQLYRWIVNPETEFTIGRVGKLRFAHFIKGELDARFVKNFSNFNSINARADVGITIPYGFGKRGDNVVPYVNQFGVGGPYSIRGWNTRELGPGGVPPLANSSEIISFAQKGDLMIEFNLEYRFKLFWYFRGALFLDAGNVWLFKKLPPEDNRPPTPQEALFGKNFINQFAVAGGYGFRFDYNLFVIRIDLGYKLRTPYADESGKHWRLKKLNFRELNFNFAVGYPF